MEARDDAGSLIVRRKKAEVRLDLGADVGFLFGISCDACKVNAFAAQLRAGIDTYLGSTRTVGFALDFVYVPGAEAKLDAGMVEIRPPPFMFRLAFIWRKSALLW